MSVDYHASRVMRELVLSQFPEAKCVDSGGRLRWRVVLWPGCGISIAAAPTKRRAWEEAAKIVRRDVRNG